MDLMKLVTQLLCISLQGNIWTSMKIYTINNVIFFKVVKQLLLCGKYVGIQVPSHLEGFDFGSFCRLWCFFASWFFYRKAIKFWIIYLFLLVIQVPTTQNESQPHGKIVSAHLVGIKNYLLLYLYLPNSIVLVGLF